MITLYGLFNIKEGVTHENFESYYQTFANHLLEKGFATGWDLTYRQPHHYYNNTGPLQKGCFALYFDNVEASDTCLEYVAADQEPLHSYHRAIQVSVENVSFFLQKINASNRSSK